MNLREKIMATPRLGDPLDVPEWNAKVYVRGLSPADVTKLEKKRKEQSDEESFDALIWQVAHGLVDEVGERIFRDEDVEWLSHQSMDLLVRLQKQVITLTHGTTEEAVDEAEKN